MAFDGDLTDRSIRFRAPKVDFETAVMVLSRQTRTFTRAVDEHTMFVTEDNAQKVREYAPEIDVCFMIYCFDPSRPYVVAIARWVRREAP